MAKNNDSHIFDDVFRTMEEHIPELMLPLINEVFKSNYSMDTKVVRLGDKRHLLQYSIETDSCLSIEDKLYHFECESNIHNGTIAVRMFQYDVTVALEEKRKENGVYVVDFPLSCVIYLRHNKRTKDKEKLLVRMPDGRSIEYIVPVLKSQNFTKDEIFNKKLYVLLPYYILKYEKQLDQLEREDDQRQQFFEEYEDICDELIEALGKENPLAYSELHKLMSRVQEYVLKKKLETKKGVQKIMGGHVLESWKEEMIRIGRTEGLAEGHAEGRVEGRVEELLENIRAVMNNLNLTAEKAMDILNVPQEDREIYMQKL